ncbi:CapA family protein [Bernardetia sp.]|uniref:CapA family protein n=1 Tax=Bernardetia sp. TaxID=1937974 RepID=UPI0025BAE65A|nr:CapA family protein [Bernardetia sp.]
MNRRRIRLALSLQIYAFSFIFIFFFACQSNDNEEKNVVNEKPIKLLFGGDILLDRGVRVEIDKQGLISLFDSLQPIFEEYKSENNFILANLECPLTDESSPIPKRFSFRVPTSYADSLKKAGFTHLFLANNHTNDHHRKGLSSTFNSLKKNGIIGIGYGETYKKSCEPVFIEKNDTKIAVFSVVRVPLENWFIMDNKPSVCQLEIKELIEEIKKLKKKEPQTIVIASLHWGTEYTFLPTTEQRKEAHLLTKAGADAIIGHHPHVTQSIEFVNNKPVFYSLGNFVFDQTENFTDRCILIEFEIQSEGVNKIQVYPLKIESAVPQFFSDKDSIEESIFTKHLKSLSKGVIFEEVKDTLSSSSTFLIRKK